MTHRILPTLPAAIVMAILLCGCDSGDKKASTERLADLVPLKVIVTDFAEIDENGVTAIYRIRGSALVTSSLKLADIDPKGERVKIEGLPTPSVDERSVKFEDDKVERIDAQRSAFTSINKTAKIHGELFASAHRAIRETASDPKVVEEAQAQIKQILEGFYHKDVKIIWKEESK